MDLDRIVISGVSGRFPSCQDVDELSEKLFAKADLITATDDRWPGGTFGLPSRYGAVKNIDGFDAELFNISDKIADCIDPGTRITIETTYEALWDAGLDPQKMGEMKVGHFSGALGVEVDRMKLPETEEAIAYTLLREPILVHTFGFNACSCVYDTACSSALSAFNEACIHLKYGLCDVAVVSTCRVSYSPNIAAPFQRLGLLSKDGKCKFLDDNASGYVKSEAVSSIVLQRKSSAKRIHCYVLASVANSDGYTLEGITFPKSESQSQLLTTALKMSGIKKEEITYIECHGTGTKAGDGSEVNAVHKVFLDGETNENRSLLLGSVKTNLGHCENASGMPSIVKCLIIFKEDMIPPSINFKTPSRDIEALQKGKVRPVLEQEPLQSTAIPLGNFGFGGSNCYLILQKHALDTAKQESQQSCSYMLFLCAARTASGLQHMMAKIEKLHQRKTLNFHFVKLLNHYSTSVPSDKMVYRSSVVVSNERAILSPISKSTARRPLYYAFPGFGAERPGAAAMLMHIESFSRSIMSSIQYIDPNNDFEILDYLLNSDCKETSCDHFALASTVFEIAFLDLLDSLGLKPDGYIGHSYGEYLAAYCDGVLNRHEMLLFARDFSRSLVQDQSVNQRLASVGMGWETLKKQVPEGIHLACLNTESNVTIGGETLVLRKFLDHLKSRNIFVRELEGISKAFHTPAYNPHRVILAIERLKLGHKPRSSKWINSHDSSYEIIPGKTESVTRLLVEIMQRRVIFHQACKSIPADSMVIEISPRRFLASLLKENLSSNSIVLSPMQDSLKASGFEFFLQQIGEVFKHGFHVKTDALFPTHGPAPGETPFLSPLIKFDHSKKRLVRKYPEYFDFSGKAEKTIEIDLNEKTFAKFVDYKMNHLSMVPFSILLKLVWQKWTEFFSPPKGAKVFAFEKLRLVKPLIINDLSPKIELGFEILPRPDRSLFQLFLGSDLIVSGVITESRNERTFLASDEEEKLGQGLITDEEVYRKISEHGYQYPSDLRCIHALSNCGRKAILAKTCDPFLHLESAIQTFLFSKLEKNLILQEIGYLSFNFQENATSCPNLIWEQYTEQFISSHLNASDLTFCDITAYSKDFSHKWMEMNSLATATSNQSALPKKMLKTPKAIETSFNEEIGDPKSMRKDVENPVKLEIDLPLQVSHIEPITEENVRRKGLVGFSGLNDKKQPIMGILRAESGESNSKLRLTAFDNQFVWKYPKNWSPQEAAKVSSSYTAAFYALMLKGSLKKGETVLIDCSHQEIGLASIRICLALDCTVFTTEAPSTVEKVLGKKSAELVKTIAEKDDLVLEVRKQTNGGVDLYLNMSNQNQWTLEERIQCVQISGRFVQLSTKPMEENQHLGMGVFLKNISFIGANWVDLFFQLPQKRPNGLDSHHWLQTLLEKGLDDGTVIPLSI